MKAFGEGFDMYGLWLHQISGLTDAKIRRLYEFCSSAKELYEQTEQTIRTKMNLEESLSEQIIESRKTWNLEKEWVDLQMKGISFVCLDDENYPKKLRNLYAPPFGIYVKGRLPDSNKKSVAIVGARECSAYGSQMAKKLGEALAKAGVLVISGLARGIDGNSHQGALDAGGETYAVLGCGVDICYPKQNQSIYNHISVKGGILSEYPPGTTPLPVLFPQRNRIISGLADCVVVIEARKKSGSLITADFAMEQGKDVYALPGRVCDSLSQGCNELIRQGAGILTGIEDFLMDFNLFDKNVGEQLNFGKILLEKDETLVYSLLDFAPVGLGTLTQKSPYTLLELLAILERLEQKGFIKEVIPNCYIKKI